MRIEHLAWSFLLLALLAAGPCGCKRSAPQANDKTAITVVKPDNRADAKTDLKSDSKPAAKADAEQADKPDATAETEGGAAPSSWSDPRVIAELIKSCAFDPDKLEGEAVIKWLGDLADDETSPLSCSAVMEQSCVFDPCFSTQEEECKPRCTKKCHGCGKRCVTACEACKRNCQDDACRMDCAKQCATCREECVRQRDRCATGTCTQEYKHCRKKLRAEWTSKGCPKICKDRQECLDRCQKKDGKDCTSKCDPSDEKGCDLLMCDDQP